MEQTFATWLANELEKRDMSQSDLARASGVTRAMVSKTINGKSGVSAKSFANISRALNLPLEFVFEKAGLLPPSGLSEAQRELIELVREMPDEDVDALIELALPIPRAPLEARSGT